MTTKSAPRRNAFFRRLRRLHGNVSGVAVTEFALVLPVLVFMGMYGTEIAYMSSVNMQASQMALLLADNASRLEQTNNSILAPTVTEADIDSIMYGAIQTGGSFDFKRNGRVILTSLEKQTATGKQYIHWQRCTGDYKVNSWYGNDTTQNGLTGTPITGLGSGATKVAAPTGIGVMFVEVFFKYQPLFGNMFVNGQQFHQEAAYIVRDSRDYREGLNPPVTTSAKPAQSLCI